MKRNMKVAQLLPDDKFSDTAYQNFERAAPGVCTYYVPAKKEGYKLTYIKTFTPIFISKYNITSGSIITKLLIYDLIIVHALSPLIFKSYQKYLIIKTVLKWFESEWVMILFMIGSRSSI